LIAGAVALMAAGGGAWSVEEDAGPPGKGDGGASVWRELAPGAERAVADDGDVRLDLFRFDLDRFDAEVVVSGRARPAHARVWLEGPGHTAAEILHAAGANGVVAVVNGGFFDGNGRSLGLRLTHGDVAVPFRGKVDWGVFYVAAHRAHIVHSSEFVSRPGIDAAIQVGPRILIAGVVPKLKPQVARRTALAVDRDGKTLTLVVADEPVEAAQLGDRLAALGFYSALLLDGGPSTQIAARVTANASVSTGTHPNSAPRPIDPNGRLDLPGGYPVPDLLAIVRR
jgi:hypothetical protein